MVNLVPAAVRLQTRFRSRIQEIQESPGAGSAVRTEFSPFHNFGWIIHTKDRRKAKSTFQKTKYLSDKRKNPDV